VVEELAGGARLTERERERERERESDTYMHKRENAQ
jgi:hypothetical protein